MDINLSKLWELVMDREACVLQTMCCAFCSSLHPLLEHLSLRQSLFTHTRVPLCVCTCAGGEPGV